MRRFLLKEWAKRISKNTWERLVFTYSNDRFRTNEVTLTENLLFEFHKIASRFRLPIRLYEARDERNNGNDIELAIETNSGYILLPCQAKRIKRNGIYDNIGYTSGRSNQRQIDLLLQYAQEHEALPIYLLYNGILDYETYERVQQQINFGIDKYGCSIALAEELKVSFVDQNINPSFDDIHPAMALPFYQLLSLIYKDLQAVPMINAVKEKIRFYEINELISDKQWKNMAPPPSIGGFPIKLRPNFHKVENKKYTPKYRALFSRNPNFNKRSLSFLS